MIKSSATRRVSEWSLCQEENSSFYWTVHSFTTRAANGRQAASVAISRFSNLRPRKQKDGAKDRGNTKLLRAQKNDKRWKDNDEDDDGGEKKELLKEKIIYIFWSYLFCWSFKLPNENFYSCSRGCLYVRRIVGDWQWEAS